MNIYTLLKFISGLALFLYGMNFMSAELEKASESRLKKSLEQASSSIRRSFCLGAFTTAIVQSSSATTVMVVGLVDSGLMKLSSATGVIIGANLGTTITAWILSLTGISDGLWILNIIKPSFFAPILAITGVIMRMLARKSRWFNVGNMLLSFSILMIGMEVMSDAMLPLSQSDSLASILTFFTNPIAGIAAGTILTAVIQSSSASVGILQALSLSVSLPYSAVIPLVIGQNIGTCATAMIASLGAGKKAKCVAFIHLYFNFIGALILSLGFYTANAFAPFSFLALDSDPVGIALLHTLFNLFSAAILLPLAKRLETLSVLTVFGKNGTSEPTKSEDEEFRLLDDRLFTSSTFAISICRETFKQMLTKATANVKLALELVTHEQNTKELLSAISDQELLVDKYESKLRSYLLRLNPYELGRSSTHELYLLLNSVEDAEQISDLAYDIGRCFSEMRKKGETIPPEILSDLKIYFESIKEIMALTLESITDNDPNKAHRVSPLIKIGSQLNNELKMRYHRLLVASSDPHAYQGTEYTDILSDCGRILSCCSSLATYTLSSRFWGTDFDVNEYLRNYESTREFNSIYLGFKKKYSI